MFYIFCLSGLSSHRALWAWPARTRAPRQDSWLCTGIDPRQSAGHPGWPNCRRQRCVFASSPPNPISGRPSSRWPMARGFPEGRRTRAGRYRPGRSVCSAAPGGTRRVELDGRKWGKSVERWANDYYGECVCVRCVRCGLAPVHLPVVINYLGVFAW